MAITDGIRALLKRDSADEWRVRYEALRAEVTDPEIIDNAERILSSALRISATYRISVDAAWERMRSVMIALSAPSAHVAAERMHWISAMRTIVAEMAADGDIQIGAEILVLYDLARTMELSEAEIRSVFGDLLERIERHIGGNDETDP